MGPTTADDEQLAMAGSSGAALVDALSTVAAEVAAMPESRGPLRRLCGDLARRVKLLSPLFDELGGGGVAVEEVGKVEQGLPALHSSFIAAKELLRSVNDGSKLYQAIRREKFIYRFDEVTENIGKALNDIPYANLDISEEVKEQIELVHVQLQRAKDNIDGADQQLIADLSSALSETHCDSFVLKRISEKLQLKTVHDIKKESIALHEMATSSVGEPDVALGDLSTLLKKLNDCLPPENASTATLEKKTSFSNLRSPVIPDDFRCPISLELMKDPVIVSTGQTYERSCIQKWLDAGHRTCPKTQQHLSHTALTPNFVLKSLIAQWCDANGVELSKKQASSRDKKSGSQSDCDQVGIHSLLKKLESANLEEQRAAAGELRLLAKRNADNRVCIAQAGAIPLLVGLLSCPDSRTQEHAVTALLNLSINEGNKSIIVKADAIPKIVEVLRNGSMEARENAAATLFSLSVVDQNKVFIGEAGAIPALIDLLSQGSPRGKKDAATAIFNLCIYQGNKVKAVRAGIVQHLMQILVDPSGGMVDEALAILAILASNPDGKVAIAQIGSLHVLIEFMKAGSPRNRENAAAVLWSVCTGDAQQLEAAKQLGIEEALKDLVQVGSDRAKRKAGSLLELIHQPVEESASHPTNM